MTVSPIAITGMGCICAAGDGVENAMTSMLTGERKPGPPTRVTTTHKVQYPVFEVPEHSVIDASGGPDLLRTAKFALHATEEALSQAGLTKADLAGKRVGVSMGTTVGCAMNNEEFNRIYESGEHPPMDAITRYLTSNPADVIARHYDLKGPRQTINNACSSGTDAIGLGASWIRAGLCDVVIAGGADELCRIVYCGFISLMNYGEEWIRPFDRDRSGLNLGEGAGIVILERNPHGDVLASVVGYGSACDAYHLTAPQPDGDGLRRAIEIAMNQAGKTTADVTFINAHGTGTTENDKVEGGVLNALFSGKPFLSTKAYTGHTLGAAGAVEVVFSVWSLIHHRLPANAGFENLDPEIPAPPITAVTTIEGGLALSESLAFGGNNAAILLERTP